MNIRSSRSAESATKGRPVENSAQTVRSSTLAKRQHYLGASRKPTNRLLHDVFDAESADSVGLVRCRRCGRMMRIHYVGKGAKEMRYLCVNGHITQGVPKCISFGGGRVDQAVSSEILKVIQPIAIDAACQAADHLVQRRSDGTRPVELELEPAQDVARLAARRYEATDPENRLEASELESRWNIAPAPRAGIGEQRTLASRIHSRPRGKQR
jgi:hypothetical protein